MPDFPTQDRNLSLIGRTAIVTGAGDGIGRAISLCFAAAGAQVVCADIDEDAAERVAAEIGARKGAAIAVCCDVAKADDAAAAVRIAVERFGSLRILVNNAAAFQQFGRVIETSEADWQRLFSVNVGGVFLMSRAAIPAIRATGGGVVVNIASQLGHVAKPGRGVYGATKAAVIQLTRAMALEHASEAIRVVSLSPGSVASDRLVRRYGTREKADRALAPSHPIGRIAETEEIARAALFLAGDDASFMTGADLVIDGGYTAQ